MNQPMIPWTALTIALDELDSVRAQLREARAEERTVRFYDLVETRMVGTIHGYVVANVIELSHGWVLLHWLNDEKQPIGLYANLLGLRQTLCLDKKHMLSLVETSERRTPARNGHVPQSRSELTPTERKILTELGHGLSNDEMAMKLRLKRPTVKNRLSAIYRKLNVHDRLQAALKARDLDLSEPS